MDAPMIFATALLAAQLLTSAVALDGGNLTLRLPAGVVAQRRRVNFETDEYTITRKSDGTSFCRSSWAEAPTI
jgi:hypothetical protein